MNEMYVDIKNLFDFIDRSCKAFLRFLKLTAMGFGAKKYLMRNYNLNIAGYIIRFESGEKGPELLPSVRFLRYICADADPDIIVNVHSGAYMLPVKAERVFHAPFAEEINGTPVHHRINFWSVWRSGSDLFIKSVLPLCPGERNAVLVFSLQKREWDLWIDSPGKETDPLEYPLDGLILYYLTVINDDIMIHASGINHSGEGYLFSGVSGKGKSTMARLWENSGARVIHDDRLILRKTENGYRMYNTPIYNNDIPQDSPLNKLFIIDHGSSNKIVPVKGAAAISLFMANCIQHNWDSVIISRLLGSVSELCESVPVMKLSFRPDKNITDYILHNG